MLCPPLEKWFVSSIVETIARAFSTYETLKPVQNWFGSL